MGYSEDKFKDHIREVVKASEYDSNRALTLDELKELALSMGLSENEWADLLIKAEESLNTALGHMKVQNYTDAIQSAEEATSINPYIKDGNALLAQCYLKLAYVDKNQDLFVKAEHYARMELTNDPLDGTALNVISAVEAEKQEGRSSKKNIKMVAIVGGGILAIVLLIVFLSKNNSTSSNQTITVNNSTNSNTIEQLSADAIAGKSIYISAIQRRNDLGLELVGAIHSESMKSDFKDALTEYDFESITKSEAKFKLIWGESKATGYFTDQDLVNMEGQTNRIATAKKRYLEKIATYNAYLKEHSEYNSSYKIIELDE